MQGHYDHMFNDDHYVRQFWESPIVGMSLCGPDKIIYDCNSSFCDILRRSRHEVIGRELSDFMQENDHKADEYLLAGVESGQLPSYERRKRYVIEEGRTIDVLVGTRAIRDKSGAFVCFCETSIPLDIVRTRENIVVQYVPHTVTVPDPMTASQVQSTLEALDKRLGVYQKMTAIGAASLAITVAIGGALWYIAKALFFINAGIQK